MDRVVIPIFYFLIIWRMKPAPINWQYLEFSFLDCESANQASQKNGVFIHQFKLEKLKLIAYQTGIHEPFNTTWSWNGDFSKLPATISWWQFSELGGPGHQLLSPTSTVASSRHQHRCRINKELEIFIFENQTLKNQNLEDALFALIAAPVDHELI